VNDNIYGLFKSRFPQDRSAIFIETEDGRSYSYRTLEQESARLAGFLTRSGVRKGDRVAVQVDKSPEALFLYLACLQAGFIYLPLNTAYKESELAYFFEDAEPSVVICRPQDKTLMDRLAARRGNPQVHTLDRSAGGSLMEEARGVEPEFPVADCTRDDVAVILYTSGTTGRPKGAMLTHGNLGSNGLALHEAWGWQENDVLLHALPLFHIHGLFVACHCVLLNGSRMIFLDRFDVRSVLRLLPSATVFMGVPTFYTRLLARSEFTRETCRNMRLFTCGSAPLLEQTFHEFKHRTGHTILERYGMTETGMNTSNPLDGPRLAGTVGLPLPGVSIRIVDDADKDVPDGDVGYLLVKGDNVFPGYWRMPEKTAEEFTPAGYFRTGDMARRDANGYISIVGRAKDLVITGGYNVYPKELESYIDELDGVVESAVIGLPHPDFGEAVTAVVVRKTEREDVTEETIIRALKERVANYKVPKNVFFVESLPRNTMGKVQKNLLRDQYADH
jgi:malonyl-CoA/methylmalonyl-CoA synthetase